MNMCLIGCKHLLWLGMCSRKEMLSSILSCEYLLFLLLFSHQVESNSFQPHGMQRARLPRPSLFPSLLKCFPGGSDSKGSTCNVGDLGLIPGLGRAPGGGHGNPPQCSCLKKPQGQRSLLSYSPWGHRVGHDWVTQHSAYHWVSDAVQPSHPLRPPSPPALGLSQDQDAGISILILVGTKKRVS